MLETGQPLHAFDFDNLSGHRIVVRTAAEIKNRSPPWIEKGRRLSEQMLMICDGEKPVAVGGVMGGLNSEIEECHHACAHRKCLLSIRSAFAKHPRPYGAQYGCFPPV